MKNESGEQDEINLKEILEVVARNRAIVFKTLGLCLLASAAVTFLMPKTYEASAIIRIGSISEPLISKAEAVMLLKSGKLLRPLFKDRKFAKTRVEVEDLKVAEFVKVMVRDTEPGRAYTLCNELSTIFVEMGQKVYADRIAFIEEEIREFRRMLGNTDAGTQTVEQKNAKEPMTDKNYNYNYNTFSNLAHIFGLNKELIASKNFEIFEPAEIPHHPISPNAPMNMLFGLIVGTVLGVSAALLQPSESRAGKNAQKKIP